MMLAIISDVVWTTLIGAALAVYLEWSRRYTATKVAAIAVKVEEVTINSKTAADNSAVAKTVGDDTKKEVDKISSAVNGGYGAMVAEISQLKNKMMGLEKEKAILDERLRGQAEAKVIAQTANVAELEHKLETTIPLTEKHHEQ